MAVIAEELLFCIHHDSRLIEKLKGDIIHEYWNILIFNLGQGFNMQKLSDPLSLSRAATQLCTPSKNMLFSVATSHSSQDSSLQFLQMNWCTEASVLFQSGHDGHKTPTVIGRLCVLPLTPLSTGMTMRWRVVKYPPLPLLLFFFFAFGICIWLIIWRKQAVSWFSIAEAALSTSAGVRIQQRCNPPAAWNVFNNNL